MPKKPAASAKHAEHSVKLSLRGATRLLGRHPWVYRSDVVGADDIPPGALVRVQDPRGKFLGTALYSSSSQIAIRMISHGSVDDLPDQANRRPSRERSCGWRSATTSCRARCPGTSPADPGRGPARPAEYRPLRQHPSDRPKGDALAGAWLRAATVLRK